jgi:hypothetical protein
MSGRPLFCVLLGAGALAGCDGLAVTSFGGTNMALQLRGSGVSAPGQHLEMWGRNSNDDILRIGYQLTPGQPEVYGFMIRTAVSLTDPCMINDSGYLLTDPRAYPGNIVAAGIVQTPDEQAKRITLLIRYVTSVSQGGLQTSSLLLTMPYDATPEPMLAADAGPGARTQACNAYWNASPYAYTPAPLTLSAPTHGVTMGAVDYSTSVPQDSFGSIDFTSLYDLRDLQEFWLTVESKPPGAVDPLHRGPSYLEGKRVQRGDGTLNFDLTGSDPAVTGSLVLILPQSGA